MADSSDDGVVPNVDSQNSTDSSGSEIIDIPVKKAKLQSNNNEAASCPIATGIPPTGAVVLPLGTSLQYRSNRCRSYRTSYHVVPQVTINQPVQPPTRKLTEEKIEKILKRTKDSFDEVDDSFRKDEATNVDNMNDVLRKDKKVKEAEQFQTRTGKILESGIALISHDYSRDRDEFVDLMKNLSVQDDDSGPVGEKASSGLVSKWCTGNI